MEYCYYRTNTFRKLYCIVCRMLRSNGCQFLASASTRYTIFLLNSYIFHLYLFCNGLQIHSVDDGNFNKVIRRKEVQCNQKKSRQQQFLNSRTIPWSSDRHINYLSHSYYSHVLLLLLHSHYYVRPFRVNPTTDILKLNK